MRAFIVTCLFCMALAMPQGYNYQNGGNLQLPGIPLISAGTSSFQQQPASIDEQRIVQQALQAPKLQQIFNQQPQQQQIFQQPQQQQQQQFSNYAYNQPQTYNHGQAPVVSKDIYVHVPPADEPEDRHPQPAVPVGPPRKHYRIVFIKAPTPSVSKATLRVKQAPIEEKTIIYVLTKKPDPLDLQTAIEEAPKPISKPEVFFIKYKTQEEAAHAQRTIQAQYDQLGGTTQVSDEGVAPVTSVIGSLDNQRGIGAGLSGGNANGGIGAINGLGSLTSAISSKYLPANLRA
ncbi:mediator of RNA polymerase II transcription subunit 15 [Drosophila grimshawi]|uniref:GH21845 n=1 Tax=Drosophila grimshawi TaxID=7222 RepID=B4JS19_DROGR|nr:mediator of RNA polymerase II transcription subunit 15 [Drosophila grimshawi]EDV94559.1 GH21845 [Drosophila grimshawi]